MIRAREKTIYFKEKPITVLLQETDCGLQVLVTGGDRSHIGAVTVADPKGALKTVCFPTHRDDAVSVSWADRLYREYRVPVTVSAGVHYDVITKNEIKELMTETEKLLEELIDERHTEI